VVTKHSYFCTKIDSSPSETPQKFLWWLAIVLSLKYGNRLLKMTTMVNLRNFKEFNVLFDQTFQKITSIVLLQISLSNR